MFKKTYRDISVDVTPREVQYTDRLSVLRDGQWQDEGCAGYGERETCKDIASAIKRHVDNVHVLVAYITVRVCEFCASEWEPDFKIHGPCCCDKAIDEWLAEWGYAALAGGAK